MDIRWIIPVFGAVMLAGCASIVAGSTDDIAISSEPTGATIKIVDETQGEIYSGSTPATVTLKKGSGYFSGHTYEVTISQAGYAPQTVTLETSLSGWYLAGNLVFGGLIGWFIVDPISGAMWTIDPETVHGELASQTSRNDMKSLTITLLENLPDDLRERMVRVN